LSRRGRGRADGGGDSGCGLLATFAVFRVPVVRCAFDFFLAPFFEVPIEVLRLKKIRRRVSLMSKSKKVIGFDGVVSWACYTTIQTLLTMGRPHDHVREQHIKIWWQHMQWFLS
jgi:hypothetical protein